MINRIDTSATRFWQVSTKALKDWRVALYVDKRFLCFFILVDVDLSPISIGFVYYYQIQLMVYSNKVIRQILKMFIIYHDFFRSTMQ